MTGVDAETLGPGAAGRCADAAARPGPGAQARLRFRHALSREAVYEALLPSRTGGAGRCRARRASSALHPGFPAAVVSTWPRGWRSRPGGGSRAAGLLVAAGRAAAGRGALAAATALLDEAVGQAAGDLDATAAAEEALVETLALAGDAQRALSVGYRLLRTLEAADADVDRQAARPAGGGAGRDCRPDGWPRPTRCCPGLAARRRPTPTRCGSRAEALAALIALEAGRDADATARAQAALAAAEAAGRAGRGLPGPGGAGPAGPHPRPGRGRPPVRPRPGDRRAARAAAVAGPGAARGRHRRVHRHAGRRRAAPGPRRRRGGRRRRAGRRGRPAPVGDARGAVRAGGGARRRAAQRRRLDPARAARQAGFGWVCVAQAHAVAGRRAETEAAAARARELASGAEMEAYLWGQCLALLALVEEDRPRALAELARSMEYVRSGEPVSVAQYRGLWPLLATLDGDRRGGRRPRRSRHPGRADPHRAAGCSPTPRRWPPAATATPPPPRRRSGAARPSSPASTCRRATTSSAGGWSPRRPSPTGGATRPRG